MAKFSPGPAVAEVRGSVGGTTFSRNRYGAYMRFRAQPTVSTTSYATAAKARMTAATQAWQGLTASQKASWNHWALSNPITGSLGEPQILTGHAAYVGLHVRALLAVETPLTDPPINPAPLPLTSCVQDCDLGLGDVDLTFAATPLAADEVLWIRSCITDSLGINYVENLLKFTGISAKAQASPFINLALITARIGAPIVGQTLTSLVYVFSATTMLLSAPLRTSDICDSTV